jgi:hypothetical protein
LHARYGNKEAVISIPDGGVVAGAIPHRALELVREWADLHRSELDENWKLARESMELNAIAPLL